MPIPNAPAQPIEVSNQTATPPIFAALRYALTAVGAWLIGKGYISDDTLEMLTALVTVVAPTVYGVWLSYRNKQKLIATAEAAPNSVAKVTK